MEKHTLYVFLLVVLVVPLILSCEPSRSPLPPEIENTPSKVSVPSTVLTSTPSSNNNLPIFPPETSLPDYYEIPIVRALVRLGLYDEAIAEINKKHSQDFDEFTYINMCLEIALHGDAADVLPICDEAVDTFPRYEEALYARGIARAQTGDYDGAISDLERFWEIYSNRPEKKYSSKTFVIKSDVCSFEDRIYKWIDVLKTQENPITNAEIKNLPVFKFTNIVTSDYEMHLMEYEQRALIRYGYYEEAMRAWNSFFSEEYPPDFDHGRESNPELRQQDYILQSLIVDVLKFNTVCLHGCFAGDIGSVDLYCERADQIYKSVPEYFDPEEEHQFFKALTISQGIYMVYRGEFGDAKTFFEEYLLWQQKPETHNEFWYVPDETLEMWIEKLDNNEFPFEQDEISFLLEIYPWN
jgi:hypothetical protein